jgi:hypothetical protein
MPTREENAVVALEMQEHISAQQVSGLSIRQYCREKGLGVHRFNYWFYKSKRQGAGTNKVSGFTQVRPSAPVPTFANAPVEITLPNGVRIGFHSINPLDLFKTLL